MVRLLTGLLSLAALTGFGVALLDKPVPSTVSAVETKLRGDLAKVVRDAQPGERISISIVMKERASKFLMDQLSTIPNKRARRAQVIELLKAVAEASQVDLMDLLRQETDKGNAGDYLHSLWISNVIGTRANADLIRRIAQREDVAWINYDKPLGEEVFPTEPAEITAADDDQFPAEIECGVDVMGAPRVWNELGITGQGSIIAIIDTGTCIEHSDLENQLWTNPGEVEGDGIDNDNNGFIDDIHGWSFDRNGSNSDISDNNGHGTHVAGTVGGDGTGGTQTGMAPDVQIMTCKFWNSFSGELSVWLGMQYATDNGADATTASLGWPHSTNPDRVTWREVCENTIAAGLVVIYAAGNEGCGNPPHNVRTPGDVPDVITVGATDCNDNRAGFTSCGPVTWENIPPWNDCGYPPGCIKPTIAAPGVDTKSCQVCSGYRRLSGTSMATPHVAGTVALMLEANPNLTHFDIKAILEGTAVDLGEAGKDNIYGSGRVDAYEAVVAAAGQDPTLGACCMPDGSCEDMFPQDCNDAGGKWNFGTDCATFTCPEPGACCLPGGACAMLTEEDCATAGGEYFGDGTPCGNLCPCDKVKKFKSKCKANGKIKVVTKFKDTSFHNTQITISIDGVNWRTIVIQRKAKLVIGPYDPGTHTVTLVDPDCGNTVEVTCQ